MPDTMDLELYQEWRDTKRAEAFAELVARHAPMAYSVCRRILSDPARSADATVEVFQFLAFAPEGPRRNLASWLHTAAVDRASSHIRPSDKRSREKKSASSEDAGLTNNIDSAIEQLPWRFRVTIIGQFAEEKTLAELAAETGVERDRMAANAVKGIESLRKLLASAHNLKLPASRLKEFLDTNLVEPVPSHLVSLITERALADSAPARRLAAGFSVDESSDGGGSGKMLMLAAIMAVIAVMAFAFWPKGGDDGQQEQIPATSPADSVAASSIPDGGTDKPGRRERVVDTTALQPVTARISGTVRDKNGQPLAGANVAVGKKPRTDFPMPPGIVTTDASGSFIIENAPPNTREISAWMEGFLPMTLNVAGRAGNASNLEIALEKAASITGILLYAGAPVGGQSVQLTYVTGDTASVKTELNGSYRFDEVRAGVAQVKAALSNIDEMNRQRVMYQNVLVEPGGFAQTDFVFGVSDTAISGYVTYDNIQGSKGRIYARVQTPSGGEEVFERSIQSEGEEFSYVFEALPAGTTILQIRGIRAGKVEIMRNAQIQTASGQTSELDFDIVNDASIRLNLFNDAMPLPPDAKGFIALLERGDTLSDLDWTEYVQYPVNVYAMHPLPENSWDDILLQGIDGAMQAGTLCVYIYSPRNLAAEYAGELPENEAAVFYSETPVTIASGRETNARMDISR